MGNSTLFSYLIKMCAPDPAQSKHQQRLVQALLITLCGIVILTPLIIGCIFIWLALGTGEWDDFWNNTFLLRLVIPTISLGQTVVFLALLLKRYNRSRAWVAKALLLRQETLDGNQEVAPLSAIQPKPLPGAKLPLGLSPWGPLEQPPEEQIDWIQAMGIVVPALGVISLIVLLLAWDGTANIAGIISAIISAAFTTVGLAAFTWARHMRKDIDVLADDQHLEWKRLRWWGRTRAQMDWQDARAFHTFIYEKRRAFSPGWETYQIYVLDGRQATLAWVGPPTPSATEAAAAYQNFSQSFSARTGRPLPERFTQAKFTEARTSATHSEALASHERFVDLIATRTHLPLRDLSPATEELERTAPDAIIEWGRRKMASSDLQALTALTALPRHEKKRRWWRIWYLAFAPLLTVGLLFGIASGTQNYQAQYYAQLLAQIQSHKPLFHDALSAPDGYWPLQQPGAASSVSLAYKDGSYQLTGGEDDYLIAAWTPAVYGDVAVEVTARQISGGQYPLYEDFGLALRVNAPDELMAFTISLWGSWTMMRVHGEYLANHLVSTQNNGAIHTGVGATNRLLVIMRGDQYICYINNQFMGIYHDDSLKSGHVGVYINHGAALAAFTDFTVYPL